LELKTLTFSSLRNLHFMKKVIQKILKLSCKFIKISIIFTSWFWETMKELDCFQKKRFLCFCTGSDRIPIHGIKSLKFTILKYCLYILLITRNGDDTERLPTASTCFNILLLPAYSSKDKLRQKLHTAINNAEGFGLKWADSLKLCC